ncbi:MAG: hypothetical protein GVY30_01430 [Chloroflexi bacterium]|jgi:hypothetical protein|nr:hypothetical protein [Chloroflexota bacterium]
MNNEENQTIQDPFSEPESESEPASAPEPEPTPEPTPPSPPLSPAAEASSGEGFFSNLDQKTWIIIGIVAAILLILCCCCGAIGVWFYNNGDQLIYELEQMGMVLSLFV